GNALVGGNVGVGTASPNAKLQVNGNFILGTSRAITLGGTTGYVSSDAGVLYEGGGTNWAHHFTNFRGGDIARFGTSPSAGGTPDTRVVISNSGNVGIGVPSPTAKLEVAGQVRITGGDPAAGRVLTSDATGQGSWAAPAGSNYVIARGASGGNTCVGANSTWTLAPYNNTVNITTSGRPVMVQAAVRQYKTGTCAQRGHITLRVNGTLMVDPSNMGMASTYECNAMAALSQPLMLPPGTHRIELMVMGDGPGVCTYGTFDYLMATELP
ncbi:MAG: hypothetical protein ACK4N5_08560, partial [Myxococcales bacterium]